MGADTDRTLKAMGEIADEIDAEEKLNIAAAMGADTFTEWLIEHHGVPESSRAIVRNNLRTLLREQKAST